MIEQEYIKHLDSAKNLLGFSAGVDSSALFYMLLDSGVEFDIAIVDYNMRESSKDEVRYAQELAKRYDKQCFLYVLDTPIKSNFESNARDIRYKFFEELIYKYNYQNLLLAHQLNDKMEWFMMQFSRGAGLNNLLGFENIESRNIQDKSYRILRPLGQTSRDEILRYITKHKIKYFIDDSNYDTKYKRNYFRSKFVNQLLGQYAKGISKSFSYLHKDKKNLSSTYETLPNQIYRIRLDKDYILLEMIDKIAKKLGVVLSSKNREEILKSDFSCEIKAKIMIDKNEKFIYLCQSVDDKSTMPKEIKNIFQKYKIPPKIRPYMYKMCNNKEEIIDLSLKLI